MTNLQGWKKICAAFLFCIAIAIISPAQATLATLATFDGPNGSNPQGMVVVQGVDGNLYGTTGGGGTNDEGTVFKSTPAGTLATLYSFCSLPLCADGTSPIASLVQATNGEFYGTTFKGGNAEFCTYPPNNCGTIFKITPSGKLTTLYVFCAIANCVGGALPRGGLVQDANGNLYGTATDAAFEITPAGTLVAA
jgi:uncharacterized repeat protein (TIGR03803 family)